MFGFGRKRIIRKIITGALLLVVGTTVVPSMVKGAKTEQKEQSQKTEIVASAMSRDEKIEFLGSFISEETLEKTNINQYSDEELTQIIDNTLAQLSEEDVQKIFSGYAGVINRMTNAGVFDKMFDFLENKVMPAAFKSGLYETMFKAIGVDTESEEYQKLYEMGVSGGNFND